MHFTEKFKRTSDGELLAINTAIFSRTDYNGKESAPYEGLVDFDDWTEAVDSELHKRGINHKH